MTPEKALELAKKIKELPISDGAILLMDSDLNAYTEGMKKAEEIALKVQSKILGG